MFMGREIGPMLARLCGQLACFSALMALMAGCWGYRHMGTWALALPGIRSVVVRPDAH